MCLCVCLPLCVWVKEERTGLADNWKVSREEEGKLDTLPTAFQCCDHQDSSQHGWNQGHHHQHRNPRVLRTGLCSNKKKTKTSNYRCNITIYQITRIITVTSSRFSLVWLISQPKAAAIESRSCAVNKIKETGFWNNNKKKMMNFFRWLDPAGLTCDPGSSRH